MAGICIRNLLFHFCQLWAVKIICGIRYYYVQWMSGHYCYGVNILMRLFLKHYFMWILFGILRNVGLVLLALVETLLSWFTSKFLWNSLFRHWRIVSPVLHGSIRNGSGLKLKRFKREKTTLLNTNVQLLNFPSMLNGNKKCFHLKW